MGSNKHYRKTENQDAYITETQLLDLKHCHFFAVVDGHGINGKEIANKVQKRLRTLLENEMEEELIFGEDRIDLSKTYPRHSEVEKAINITFDKMQMEIDEMIEDGRYSGCTCTCVLIFGKQLYVANLGDSRQVLIKKKQSQRQTQSLFAEQIGPPELDFTF
jgi:serine/threonine protein phosphatase PrpC